MFIASCQNPNQLVKVWIVSSDQQLSYNCQVVRRPLFVARIRMKRAGLVVACYSNSLTVCSGELMRCESLELDESSSFNKYYPTPKAILFDLDGTLLNTMQEFANLAAEIIRASHQATFADARRMYLETSGLPFTQQLDSLFPDHPLNANAVVEFERRKKKISAGAMMSDEAIEGLIRLKELGVHIAIASNNDQAAVDSFASRSPFHFHLCMGYSDTLSKGITQFTLATQRFQCALSDLLFVGDSLTDATLSYSLGVPFAAMTGTFAAEEFKALFPGCLTVCSVMELASQILD